VLVTSPTPGDGKTLTVVNLALTIAKTIDQTVLVVDCDLRRQAVHKTLGVQSSFGLQDYLAKETPLEQIIMWPGIDKLSFISGGGSIVNSSEVLASPHMKALVSQLKDRYEDRIILFDAPPILSGSDSLALMPLVDCVVMVVAEGKTSMKDVQQAIEVVPREKLIGFVMNRQRDASISSYYY
jgi:non-specific protein-tyrosine kinase